MNNTRKFWLFSMILGALAMTGCADPEVEEEEGSTEQAAKKGNGGNNNGGNNNGGGNHNGQPRTITPEIAVKGRDVTVRLHVSERDTCANYKVRYVVFQANGQSWTSEAKDAVNPGDCRPARFTWQHARGIEKTDLVCIKVHNNNGLMTDVNACTYPQ